MAKKCPVCKKTLPDEAFEMHKKARKDGSVLTYPRNRCRECHQKKTNEAKSSSPKKYLSNLYTHLQYSRKTRDKKIWEVTREEILDLWDKQEGRCALTNQLMTYKKGAGRGDLNVSIDRIDPKGIYTISNIQLVCFRVNIMKHTLDESSLVWWCKNIVTHNEES
jgi:5-methylcytosine-specific restriction endonuclease McrA